MFLGRSVVELLISILDGDGNRGIIVGVSVELSILILDGNGNRGIVVGVSVLLSEVVLVVCPAERKDFLTLFKADTLNTKSRTLANNFIYN
jgi:hypothetical protein